MTNKQFSKIFRKYKKEAMACLRPKNDYAWGDTKRTLILMNEILKEIPKNVWPESKEKYDSVILKDGNWRLDLITDCDIKSANLIYARDDHTAWVVEKKDGTFEDFDIGGS